MQFIFKASNTYLVGYILFLCETLEKLRIKSIKEDICSLDEVFNGGWFYKWLPFSVSFQNTFDIHVETLNGIFLQIWKTNSKAKKRTEFVNLRCKPKMSEIRLHVHHIYLDKSFILLLRPFYLILLSRINIFQDFFAIIVLFCHQAIRSKFI